MQPISLFSSPTSRRLSLNPGTLVDRSTYVRHCYVARSLHLLAGFERLSLRRLLQANGIHWQNLDGEGAEQLIRKGQRNLSSAFGLMAAVDSHGLQLTFEADKVRSLPASAAPRQ